MYVKVKRPSFFFYVGASAKFHTYILNQDLICICPQSFSLEYRDLGILTEIHVTKTTNGHLLDEIDIDAIIDDVASINIR
jgi:hypothetical protein